MQKSGGQRSQSLLQRPVPACRVGLRVDALAFGLLQPELFRALRQVRHSGVSILLVEQNARRSLAIADRGYLLENGRVAGEGSAGRLLHDPAVQAAYLGMGGTAA